MAQIEQMYGKNVILELKEVSKTFLQSEKNDSGPTRRHVVLDRLNLRIREGEFVTIVGTSGCGKSTLLNIIAGLDAPDSGLISVKSNNNKNIGKAERVVIFQEGALFPWLTVTDNVEFGLKIARIPKELRKEIASNFIDMVHLTRFADSYVYQLSGGMKQRVAIARALALDAQILLMDEPFAALDVQTREILHEQLLQIHKSTGKTILFVTHNINEAVQLGDRIILLSPHTRSIKREIVIDYPKPRDIESPEISAIRRELLNELQEDFRFAKTHS
ncbi:ABC uptake transporter, ATP-binding protein [Candidatus Nitrososphaera gargensis Ga9.2]|uniref:ABC uptake transporter, ATP-binding protein n=1 Tax=Nitrososphaera gargensis (strain Ga9.2) TaxID=1237085 RepID=K0IML0_NITGG|nr:ABC transporter ATP-binding protein [Candidatus Nitrososphaera gargensis]AFU57984.1 ABC uptake transporter, ATP-binding protein [Candidatus Nitrososphaera gargensis Ga9.2]